MHQVGNSAITLRIYVVSLFSRRTCRLDLPKATLHRWYALWTLVELCYMAALLQSQGSGIGLGTASILSMIPFRNTPYKPAPRDCIALSAWCVADGVVCSAGSFVVNWLSKEPMMLQNCLRWFQQLPKHKKIYPSDLVNAKEKTHRTSTRFLRTNDAWIAGTGFW